jgi:hypothetical protein
MIVVETDSMIEADMMSEAEFENMINDDALFEEVGIGISPSEEHLLELIRHVDHNILGYTSDDFDYP